MTIIGLGTARGGTQSLAHWLGEQGLDVGHECTTSIDWKRERPERYRRALNYLRDHDGDVAHWLTQAAGDLMEDLDDAKIIAMVRDKDDTVESMMECFMPTRIRSDRPYGPMCFPTYTECSLEEAWVRYWERYQAIITKLTAKYPDRTLQVGLEWLQTYPMQQTMARFLVLKDWIYVEHCHKGKRAAR